MKKKANAKPNSHHGLSEFRDGKDENNLAEFPIALLSDRAEPGQKTIEFQDTMTDWKTGQVITRRVSITGSDKFGLPTAKDEQVLLALVQLTKLANGFTNPEVWFTKHQVIELLGWQNRGWAYDRVEESLHRWKGVSIHYWNAWRDNKQGVWTDTEAIGVIDYFRITDSRRRKNADDRNSRSRFLWNRILFESFQAGYLKPLDFNLYRSLERAAAKRAYRFLDKRFHHQPAWEFDLRVFACEKLGFSRSYDTGQLKERLRPALGELETVGFIEPVEYRKGKPKQWKIAICKKSDRPKLSDDRSSEKPSDLAAALVKRGIEVATADDLVSGFSAECIAEKVAFFDWLVARQDKRISTNPPGFLVAAIRHGYPLPKDYLKAQKIPRRTSAARSEAIQQNLASCKPAAMRPKEACVVAPTARPSAAPTDEPNIETYLRALSPDELEHFEASALEHADAVVVDGYHRSKEAGGAAHGIYRRMLLEREVLRLLRQIDQVPKAAKTSSGQ
ncbi:MAG: replication initiator protein A [Pirellulales bacterium]